MKYTGHFACLSLIIGLNTCATTDKKTASGLYRDLSLKQNPSLANVFFSNTLDIDERIILYTDYQPTKSAKDIVVFSGDNLHAWITPEIPKISFEILNFRGGTRELKMKYLYKNGKAPPALNAHLIGNYLFIPVSQENPVHFPDFRNIRIAFRETDEQTNEKAAGSSDLLRSQIKQGEIDEWKPLNLQNHDKPYNPDVELARKNPEENQFFLYKFSEAGRKLTAYGCLRLKIVAKDGKPQRFNWIDLTADEKKLAEFIKVAELHVVGVGCEVYATSVLYNGKIKPARKYRLDKNELLDWSAQTDSSPLSRTSKQLQWRKK